MGVTKVSSASLHVYSDVSPVELSDPSDPAYFTDLVSGLKFFFSYFYIPELQRCPSVKSSGPNQIIMINHETGTEFNKEACLPHKTRKDECASCCANIIPTSIFSLRTPSKKIKRWSCSLCFQRKNKEQDHRPTTRFMKTMKEWFDIHDTTYTGSAQKRPISMKDDPQLVWLENELSCYVWRASRKHSWLQEWMLSQMRPSKPCFLARSQLWRQQSSF